MPEGFVGGRTCEPAQPILDALSCLTGASLGVLLYGSHARGDSLPSSDIDLLQVVENSPRSYAIGRVSVVAYTVGQLGEMCLTGSLFAWHLRTEGIVLDDPSGAVSEILRSGAGPNWERTLQRVLVLSQILDVNEEEFERYANRLIRTARYLLRTTVYARAIAAGGKSFSVEIATSEAGVPHLYRMFARDLALASSWATFNEYRVAIRELLGPLMNNPYLSLEALAVNAWDLDRQLASLAIQTMMEKSGEIEYTSLPSPVL